MSALSHDWHHLHCHACIQEREAHAQSRSAAAKLQADLTELQAASTIAAAQAAADKVGTRLGNLICCCALVEVYVDE
jgi:hypothetical protein